MVSVDETKCIGCGACVAVCPNVFEMKGDKAAVKDAAAKEDCNTAASSCPTHAISL